MYTNYLKHKKRTLTPHHWTLQLTSDPVFKGTVPPYDKRFLKLRLRIISMGSLSKKSSRPTSIPQFRNHYVYKKMEVAIFIIVSHPEKMALPYNGVQFGFSLSLWNNRVHYLLSALHGQNDF